MLTRFATVTLVLAYSLTISALLFGCAAAGEAPGKEEVDPYDALRDSWRPGELRYPAKRSRVPANRLPLRAGYALSSGLAQTCYSTIDQMLAAGGRDLPKGARLLCASFVDSDDFTATSTLGRVMGDFCAARLTQTG
jgi:hypothetical protein